MFDPNAALHNTKGVERFIFLTAKGILNEILDHQYDIILDASDLVVLKSQTNQSLQTAGQWTLSPGGIVLEEIERQLL